MAAHVYPQDALFASRQTAGTPSAPSLTASDVTQLYQWWLNRPPMSDELASELDNATRYSAAGIERQIANRAGNVAGSGVRGDEGAPSLTVQPAPILDAHAGSVASVGVAAIAPYAPAQAGPVGLQTPYGANVPTQVYQASVLPGGISLTTILIGAAVIGAAYFLIVKGAR